MERLTERSENGKAVYRHPTPEPEGWEANRSAVLERCCQYEDTDLTPEEIAELKEKNTAQKMYNPNPNMYYCLECGEKIKPMWGYCPWCGQHVTDN